MESKVGDFVYGHELLERWPIGRNQYGLFICKHCGEWFEAYIGNIVSGNTDSCGCQQKKAVTTHGLSKHKSYGIWRHIKQRCLNPNCSAYKDYGARGISIQEDWIKEFTPFFIYVTNLKDYPGESGLGKRKLTLDRINNDGNYEEGNLRWATAKEQANNRRNTRT